MVEDPYSCFRFISRTHTISLFLSLAFSCLFVFSLMFAILRPVSLTRNDDSPISHHASYPTNVFYVAYSLSQCVRFCSLFLSGSPHPYPSDYGITLFKGRNCIDLASTTSTWVQRFEGSLYGSLVRTISSKSITALTIRFPKRCIRC